MIPDDVDPSLCAAEPLLESLEDGFSPPSHADQPQQPGELAGAASAEAALGPKSPF